MKSYRYVDGEYEARQEIKRSRFIATVKGEVDGEGAEAFVREVRGRYPDATHNCYAYISDEAGNAARFSDDGEPGGTAGQPILDVLKKQDLKKTAIVVTRYFGGVKLGASGLVGAYSGAAAEALKAAKICEKRRCELLKISIEYADLALVEKAIRKAGRALDNVDYKDFVEMSVYVEEDGVESFVADASEITLGRAKIAKTGVFQFKTLG